jgi:AcrR family transcriptional regulator
MNKQRRPSKRDTIVEAAAAIARQEGVLGLSIDRVLDKAGLSKGGFFYHFRTKDELVEAVVNAELDRFESLVELHMSDGARFARALVLALLEFIRTDATMMASVNAALSLGGPVRRMTMERRGKWRQALRNERMEPERATLLATAIDGAIFSCSYRGGPPPAQELRELEAALMWLAK